MDAQDYARAQQRPLVPLQKLIRAVLHALGVPLTEQQVTEVATRLWRPVTTARDLNYTTALNYLGTAAPDVPIPPPRAYPFEALTSTIAKVTGDLRIEGDPVNATSRADTRVIETAQKAIAGPVTRQVLEPARETVAAIGEDETNPAAANYGWARVLVGASSCSFCAMLASRGPVYTSKAAAVGKGGSPMDVYHHPYLNHNGKLVGGYCDCVAVMVPRGRKWEGQAAHKKLEKLWLDTTEGFSGADARNVFRQEWEKQVRAGKTDQYVPQPPEPKPAPKPPPAPKPKPEPVEIPELKPVLPEPAPSLPAPTVPEPELKLPRITEQLTPEQDLALVNPRWQDSRYWQINCTRCTTAVELRARGYDVTSTPMPRSRAERDNDYVSILARWESPDGTRAGQAGALGSRGTIDRAAQKAAQAPTGPGEGLGAALLRGVQAEQRATGDEPLGMAHVYGAGGGPGSGASRVWDYLPAGRGQDGGAKLAADEAVRTWGPGSRGYITVEWAGRGAHIFNVENVDGKVIYKDGQSNKIDASGHWDKIGYGEKRCRIVRVDDLIPVAPGQAGKVSPVDWVQARDAKYLKSMEKLAAKAAAKEAARPPYVAEVREAARDHGYEAARGYKLFKAFNDGAVRGAFNDALPEDVAREAGSYGSPATPEQIKAYREGFEWVKKWKAARQVVTP